MKYKNSAFTLVELMVVVVILAILATVGFISYENYLVDARDGKRIAQIDSLRDSMRLATTKGNLPLPDNAIEIRNNGNAFLYQGYMGKSALESIAHDSSVMDPKDDVYYTYMLAKNRKDFQLMAFLEKYNSAVISLSSPFINTYASEDYSQRYPNVTGQKLGILLQQQTNTPLQEMSGYQVSGYIDLQDSTTNMFDAYITDTRLISGTGNDLIGIIPYTTCKKIIDNGGSYGDGIYNINPTGLDPFEAYCNMTLDGGGWTLVARSVSGATLGNFGWLVSSGNIRNDMEVYSMGESVKNFNFSEILASTYTSEKNINYASKVSVDKTFINNISSQTTVQYTQNCKNIYPNPVVTSWTGPCNDTNGHGLDIWGFFVNPSTSNPKDNGFYFRKYVASISYGECGLNRSVYSSCDSNTFGVFAGKPGMIFVR